MARPTIDGVQFRFLPLVASIVLALAVPVAAQVGDPGLAPAIGQWAGAPRGHLTTITPGDDSLTIEGVASDPDSAQSITYEILVDGLQVAAGATPRPSGFGRTAAFSEAVRVTPGMHRVCLRLLDDQRSRTVNCRNAVTSPPVTVSDEVIAEASGVAISNSGVVLPILGGSEGNWTVETPCGATTTLSNATIVERARVVIDPGHGGSESGAVGGGLLEKNVNLQVSELVIDKFEQLGISAILTRTGDYRVPIQTRANIATAVAPDVFLSLHHNGGAVRRSSRPGTEIFYSQARPESERLARVLYDELNAAAAQFDAQWVSTVSEGASLRHARRFERLLWIHGRPRSVTERLEPCSELLDERADVLRGCVHMRPRVTALFESMRHRQCGESVRLHRFKLIPGNRRRDLRSDACPKPSSGT